MYYIFGLGNPGRKYKETRHNAGFRVVDILARRHGIKLKSDSRMDAELGQGMIGNERVMLAKPQTFMNESGYAVGAVADYYNVPDEKIIVVYDDIDLPFGTLRIREKGSAGTHNGMRSVIGYLGGSDFPRLRVGIGKPEYELKDYVLGKFAKEQRGEAEQMLERAADAVETMVTDGVQAAQERYQK